MPLVGGHGGGANVLARSVAELLGAKPVITTATDVRHLVALDLLPGFVARGDVAGVSRYLLDHGSPNAVFYVIFAFTAAALFTIAQLVLVANPAAVKKA